MIDNKLGVKVGCIILLLLFFQCITVTKKVIRVIKYENDPYNMYQTAVFFLRKSDKKI